MIKVPQTQTPVDYVFALTDVAGLLRKLYWEIRQLQSSLVEERTIANTHAPAYHAFNCAVTCWHLVDWVWQSADDELRARICASLETSNVSEENFKSAICRKHRAIEIAKFVANGSKHLKLRKNDPSLKTEQVWKYKPARAGSLQAGQPLGSYDYGLTILDEDVRRDVIEVFSEAADAWRRELQGWFFIEDSLVDGD